MLAFSVFTQVTYIVQSSTAFCTASRYSFLCGTLWATSCTTAFGVMSSIHTYLECFATAFPSGKVLPHISERRKNMLVLQCRPHRRMSDGGSVSHRAGRRGPGLQDKDARRRPDAVDHPSHCSQRTSKRSRDEDDNARTRFSADGRMSGRPYPVGGSPTRPTAMAHRPRLEPNGEHKAAARLWN
ncbi:hypothetical protein B0H14DRAFT_1061993 [Mycena olivaceomarginata]|nr:hypothetical protein B0H14DRAFT_1061993 [Mycena olivaceomarginata]